MTIKRRCMVAVSALMAITAPASGQEQAPQSSPDHDIIVTARREKEIRHFVSEMSPWRYGRQMARWNDPICVQVTGLEDMPSKVKLIRDRLTEIARSVRIAVIAHPDCHPNLLITFSTAADSLTAKVIEKYPLLIKDVRRFGLPHRHDRAPYLEPRAVRWFAVDDEILAATGKVIDGPDASGPSPGMPSRIVEQVKENASFSYAIVDESKVGGITWRQLADYLAMATLTRPDLSASYTGEDSIMAVFDDRDQAIPPPPHMTAQDNAYLEALYLINPTLPPGAQRNQIERRIMRSLAAATDRNAQAGAP